MPDDDRRQPAHRSHECPGDCRHHLWRDLFELVLLKMSASCLSARIGSNYRLIIGFTSALIAMGVAGILPPATSALLHNLSTLGISLRSMANLPE